MSDGTCPAIVLSARHDLVLKLSCPQCALRQPTLRHMCLWQTFLRSSFFVLCVFGFLLVDLASLKLMVRLSLVVPCAFLFVWTPSLTVEPYRRSFPFHLNQSSWLVCYQLTIVKAWTAPVSSRVVSFAGEAFHCFYVPFITGFRCQKSPKPSIMILWNDMT